VGARGHSIATMELTAAEGRVLGCLIEQEAAAPDAVPLSLNALRLACNQTTGRHPVVAYDDRTVEDTLLQLKSRGLARFVPPSSEARTTRYRHRADERWRMGPADLAVLAVLLLRGVQTVGEVRSHVQRLYPAVEPGEVDAVLDSLAARTPRPFAARIERRPGDHDTRWVQVLTAPAPTPAEIDEAAPPPGNGGHHAEVSHVPAELASPSYAELVARVAELEQRLASSFDRRAAPPSDWATPAFPPPPPPVEVRSPPAPQLGVGDDDHRHDRGAAPAAPERPGRLETPYSAADLEDVADRLRDIERRLARIEAELGALR
jgi:uncharacterized protein